MISFRVIKEAQMESKVNFGRKRTYSGGCNNNNNNNNNGYQNKKKKKFFLLNKRAYVPPTKFLLGGNIRDPLNLCGLADEDEPTEEKEDDDRRGLNFGKFLLGGDIHDPLNLKSIAMDEKQPLSATTASDDENNAREINGADNHNGDEVDGEQVSRKRQTSCSSQKSDDIVTVDGCEKKQKLNLSIEQQNNSTCVGGTGSSGGKKPDHRRDKIVSPVIPQPYVSLRNIYYNKHQVITPRINRNEQTPQFKEKNSQFEYGNYNRYYGYRNGIGRTDLRLEALANHKRFFQDKDVLDIGCNIGHISLIIGRDFNAKSVLGVDIDRSLINIAKKNVKYYVSCCPSPHSPADSNCSYFSSSLTATEGDTVDDGNIEQRRHRVDSNGRKIRMKNNCYPVSMPILYGLVDRLGTIDDGGKQRKLFPKNVSFVHGNYVLDSDALLSLEQPQFDTIVCFSLTKWLHLNWGDAGLKRAFKRMFLQLRPGGILILEPQSWDSYVKKKSLTEKIWRNYLNIQFFPHHFDQYLLSSEVGFSRCQTVAVINHQHKGFRRPLKIFIKAEPTIAKPAVCSPGRHPATDETTSKTKTDSDISSFGIPSTAEQNCPPADEILDYSAEKLSEGSRDHDTDTSTFITISQVGDCNRTSKHDYNMDDNNHLQNPLDQDNCVIPKQDNNIVHDEK